MGLTQLFRYAGWSAWVSGVSAAVGVALLLVFFAVGEPFETFGDIATLPQYLALLPLVWASYQSGKDRSVALSSFALVVGAAGMLAAATLQALLVIGVITIWEENPPLTGAFGAIGLWLIMTNRLWRVTETLPGRLARLGLILGAIWVLANAFFWPGFWLQGGLGALASDVGVLSRLNPLLTAGFVLVLAGSVLFPVWAIWLGRRLLSGRLSNRGVQS